MEENYYTIKVDRFNPQEAINEITKRTHDAIIEEFVKQLPPPINGITFVKNGTLSEIAKKFSYSVGGVQKLLERRGYYCNGVVPPKAPCFNKEES